MLQSGGVLLVWVSLMVALRWLLLAGMQVCSLEMERPIAFSGQVEYMVANDLHDLSPPEP